MLPSTHHWLLIQLSMCPNYADSIESREKWVGMPFFPVPQTKCYLNNRLKKIVKNQLDPCEEDLLMRIDQNG